MELSENRIFAEQFWREVDLLGRRARNREYVERLVFLLLFLTRLRANSELHILLQRHIPNASSVQSWLHWLTTIKSEQVKAIADVYMNVANALGYPKEARSLDAIEDPELVTALLTRVSDLLDDYAIKRHGLVEAAFDYGFFRTLSSNKSVDIVRERYLASLASSIAGPNVRTIADAFHQTGQCAIDLSQEGKHSIHYVLGQSSASLGLTLAMRLAIRNVSVEVVDLRSTTELTAFLKRRSEFILFDLTAISRNGEGLDNNLSSRHFLADLVEWRADYCPALLVVPNALATTRGPFQSFRRNLIERGQVMAVIDLPKTRVTRGRCSCWLVRGRAKMGEQSRVSKVLCIDGNALSHFSVSEDSFPDIDFIAGILSLVYDGPDFAIRGMGLSKRENTLLNSIFAREFREGYHDVPGLCSLVPVEQLEFNSFDLAAHKYVLPSPSESWLTGFDWEPLRTLLEAPAPRGRTAYLIGNNGEGKSLLLKRIASDYADRNLRTLAIALGASDRFGTKSRQTSYRYLGIRTSSSNINLRHMASSAAMHMLQIHNDSKRMEVFDEVADLLEFSSEQFLIPIKMDGDMQVEHSPLRGIIRLRSTSDDDVRATESLMMQNDRLRFFKLGLRKRQDFDHIIPFDELSSGEQQVLLLASKLIANAERGAVALIDEPEISLHVRWQRAIPKILSVISRKFEMDIVVATHSPVLVASARGEQDYCFRAKDRELTVIPREERHSVETALFEGFQTHTPNNRDIHERCAALVGTCIELSGRDELDSKALNKIFEKLDDMKMTVEGGFNLEAESLGEDIDLIVKTKAAIEEAFKPVGEGEARRRSA